MMYTGSLPFLLRSDNVNRSFSHNLILLLLNVASRIYIYPKGVGMWYNSHVEWLQQEVRKC